MTKIKEELQRFLDAAKPHSDKKAYRASLRKLQEASRITDEEHAELVRFVAALASRTSIGADSEGAPAETERKSVSEVLVDTARQRAIPVWRQAAFGLPRVLHDLWALIDARLENLSGHFIDSTAAARADSGPAKRRPARYGTKASSLADRQWKQDDLKLTLTRTSGRTAFVLLEIEGVLEGRPNCLLWLRESSLMGSANDPVSFDESGLEHHNGQIYRVEVTPGFYRTRLNRLAAIEKDDGSASMDARMLLPILVLE